MKQIFTKPLLVFMSLLFATSAFAQFDWGTSCYSGTRTSFVEQEKQLKPPFELEDEISFYTSDILVKDSVLYLINDNTPNDIQAYDLKTKKTLWTFKITGSAASTGSIPAISDTLLFAGGQNGNGLFAVDIRTGLQKWVNPIGSLYGRNPVLDNYGHVFVVTDSLYCFDVNTGETLWTYNTAGQITPSIKNDTLFISKKNSIYALNVSNGNEIWQTTVPHGIVFQLPVDNQAIYYFDNYFICAYDIKTGNKKWEYSIEGDYYPASFFTRGNACLTDSVLAISLQNSDPDKYKMLAIDKITGKKRWEQLSGRLLKSPVGANGVIYTVPMFDPVLFGLDHTTGAVVLRDDTHTFDGPMVIANHMLFAYGAGKIRVLRSRATAISKNNKAMANIRVYPNPVSDYVTIQFDKTLRNPGYRLFDLSGKLLEQKSIKSAETKINMSKYNRSSYILKLNDGQQPLQTFKIIKR